MLRQPGRERYAEVEYVVAHGLASSLGGMHVVLGFAHVVMLTGDNQQSAGRIAREVADVTLTESDLFSLVRLRKLRMGLMDRLDTSFRAIILWNSAARVRRGDFSCLLVIMRDVGL